MESTSSVWVQCTEGTHRLGDLRWTYTWGNRMNTNYIIYNRSYFGRVLMGQASPGETKFRTASLWLDKGYVIDRIEGATTCAIDQIAAINGSIDRIHCHNQSYPPNTDCYNMTHRPDTGYYIQIYEEHTGCYKQGRWLDRHCNKRIHGPDIGCHNQS